MKSSILTSFLFNLFFLSACAVTTENQVRILLNNGVESAEMTCSDADMVTVLSFVYNRANPRKLRQGKVNGEKQHLTGREFSDSRRKLQYTLYPSTCKKTCQGFAPRTCVAPSCKGYRREMKESEDNRDLQSFDAMWCDGTKSTISMMLNAIATTGMVSSSCAKLLQAPRQLDCFKVTC